MNKQRYRIANDLISAEISSLGAELKSLKDSHGKEYMYQGDPAYWVGTSPILFPICGGLKEDTFSHGGKTYTLEKHGFAQKMLYACESKSEDSVTFVLTSTEETKCKYPFDFEFRVRFTVKDDILAVSYLIKNTGSDTLYHAPGGHDAYACKGGIEQYDVIFEKPEHLERTVLDGCYLAHEKEYVATDGNILHMKYSHMDNDSLVFEKLNSKSLRFINRLDGTGVKVCFDGFDHLLLWTVQNGPYLCIEPWAGLPDFVDSDGILAHKPSMHALAPGQEEILTHTIQPIL